MDLSHLTTLSIQSRSKTLSAAHLNGLTAALTQLTQLRLAADPSGRVVDPEEGHMAQLLAQVEARGGGRGGGGTCSSW